MSQGTEKEFTMLRFLRDFPGGTVVRNPSANAGDTGHAGLIPGWGNSLQKDMATHSRMLAWEIP